MEGNHRKRAFSSGKRKYCPIHPAAGLQAGILWLIPLADCDRSEARTWEVVAQYGLWPIIR